MKDLAERVYGYLTAIPAGRAVTYGQIARTLGDPHLARAVGNALHRNPDPLKYPCFKVVDAKGRLSKNFGFGGIEAQKKMLEADGVRVSDDYTVDLSEHRWDAGPA